ncbi:hypothetical protein FRB96_003091, partial [Tulasnella sp. 330]
FLGVAEVGDATYLVSPWMGHGDLSRFVAARIEFLDTASWEQHDREVAVSIYTQFSEHNVVMGIASGLAYLHACDVIHGDLKAANILLDDSLNPKICDFGLSKVLHSEYKDTSLALKGVGSSRWMSPETMEGVSVKTTGSDVYAFGMTIAEILSGQMPLSHLNHPISIALAVLSNERPLPNPMDREGEQFGDLWKLAASCWAADVTLRPSVHEIVAALANGDPLSESPGFRFAF